VKADIAVGFLLGLWALVAEWLLRDEASNSETGIYSNFMSRKYICMIYLRSAGFNLQTMEKWTLD